MAFVQPADENGAPAPINPATGQAPVSSGGAGVGGATKTAANTAGQNTPAQPSAQLSAYLGANQPQAAAFGQNVAQSVGNQVNAAGQAILPAVNTYTGQQVGVPTDQATNAAVASSPSSLTQAQQQSFENELGAASSAPSSSSTFETSAPYAGLVTGIQNAVEQANLWNSGNNTANLNTALTTGGFEGPNATTGDTTLDSLLLSQTPGAYSQIQSATAPAASLQGQLASGAASADQALQNAIAQDQAATPAAQQAAQTYSNNLTAYLNQQVAAAQATATAQGTANNSLSNDIANNALTAADAAALGIPTAQDAAYASAFNNINPEINAMNALQTNPTRSEGNGTPLANLNLSSYLTPAAANTAADAANIATAQNYSDVDALQSLLSQANQSGLITPPINASTVGQAGTYAPSAANTYNLTGADQAAQAAYGPAQTLSQYISNSIASDPAQNGAQAGVDTAATTDISQILAYLQALGANSTGQTGGGFTTGMGGPPGID